MSKMMIGAGVVGYALAAFVVLDAPTVTQEIVGVLLATNATLFLVGGMIVGELRRGRQVVPVPSLSPHIATASPPQRSDRRDSYAEWADRLTKS